MYYQCEICGYIYSKYISLQKHEQKHRNCNICGTLKCNKISLHQHEKNCLSSMSRQCNNCLLTFETFDDLTDHINKDKCWDVKKIKQCNCCKKFISSLEYHKHISCNSKTPTYSKCTFCTKYFVNDLMMKKHIEQDHKKFVIITPESINSKRKNSKIDNNLNSKRRKLIAIPAIIIA